METQQLVKMANQIGAFFEDMPDRNQAHAEIANHLKKFWEPRMRKAIVQKMDGGEATDLSPVVRDAIDAHRGLLAPRFITGQRVWCCSDRVVTVDHVCQ
jgi:formate dehydrogenase subunit delta